MRGLFTPFTLVATLLAGACSTTPSATPHAATAPDIAYVVVRHAEKGADDPRDPALTGAGRRRASALATQLADAPVVAVYATAFRRTQQTAAPIAARHGLMVRTYDAQQAPDAFIDRLRGAHDHGTVVVVGHSNTVPGIVSTLCACAVAPIDESDYGNRYVVTIDAQGQATLRHGHD
jgi:broad specificity phosphatase PhoE